jgi:hypothetical protein
MGEPIPKLSRNRLLVKRPSDGADGLGEPVRRVIRCQKLCKPASWRQGLSERTGLGEPVRKELMGEPIPKLSQQTFRCVVCFAVTCSLEQQFGNSVLFKENIGFSAIEPYA